MRLILNLLRSEDGPTAVEYAVMLSLIIMVTIASIAAVGNSVLSLWVDILSQLGW